MEGNVKFDKFPEESLPFKLETIHNDIVYDIRTNKADGKSSGDLSEIIAFNDLWGEFVNCGT